MKHNIFMKSLGWFAATALLLTTSCQDNTFNEFGAQGSEDVNVSFVLAPEAAVGSRAVNYPGAGEFPHISDGSKADVLIYAVYDSNGDLLTGYSNGTDPDLAALGFDHGDGQTIQKISSFPVTVNLTLKRNQQYKIAFWAQSSKTKAYNTSDLKKVEVIYTELDNSTASPADGADVASDKVETSTPNNDEYRDAFCRSITITPTGTSNSLQQNIYLYRPLAQINVGTTGYDYEVVTRDAIKKYRYSKIRINRVARYLDVVEDRTYSSTTAEDPSLTYDADDSHKTPEAFSVVDFGYAPIPAYVNYEREGHTGEYELPEYTSFTDWDWVYAGQKNTSVVTPDGVTRDLYAKEEFLKIHRYSDEQKQEFRQGTGLEPDADADGYLDYVNLTDLDNQKTETYKYLSMCYVLTSSTKDQAITLNDVKVYLATDANGANEIELIHATQVPAQRNWRTNIVGNLLTEQNKFEVTLDSDFSGEYNGVYNTNSYSGPLYSGVYYNADEDVIEISNLEGLLWFQRMVNGTMTIRQTYNGSHVGEYYWYYTSTGERRQFKYDGFKESDFDPETAQRILYATHQDYNSSARDGKAGWPANNNFHFTAWAGASKVKDGIRLREQATVRLMADIDLQGIEWIPIGFDGCILEQVNKQFDQDTAKPDYGNSAAYRGFYGVFDGNGHTIYNMSTKRFSAAVQDWDMERKIGDSSNTRFIDNLQWFARGFFGELGGKAIVKNLRLVNVDVFGCQGIGAVAGLAYSTNSSGIQILNCTVDGGSLIVTPMYRGDGQDTKGPKDRTAARGIYLGGIVGYFNTVNGVVENNQVKNLYMRGYRRVGGIIGSLDLASNKDTSANTSGSKSSPKSIKGNRVENTVLLASQFGTIFGFVHLYDDKTKYYRTGMGWSTSKSYNLLAQKIVGGDSQEYIKAGVCEAGDNAFNGTFAEFTQDIDQDWNGTTYNPAYTGRRFAHMQTSPLQYMPILSSWFADDITLHSNYYGDNSAYRFYNTTPFLLYSTHKNEPANYTYRYPMSMPQVVEMDWDKNSGKVGLYVESVNLIAGVIGSTNNEKPIYETDVTSGRSVLTPNNVDGVNDCSVFITARDRKQFYDAANNLGWITSGRDIHYKEPTSITNLVVRGQPFAYTGILLSPNENMSAVTLNNVAVYDCYRTVALDETYGRANQWPNKKPNPEGITITFNNCNLRGYTVPGKGWQHIYFNKTTLETGMYMPNTGRNSHTCKVESPTSFDGCFFKAPYIIDLSAVSQNDVSFKGCKASSTSNTNVDISLEGKTGVTKITIDSDAQGRPIVKYFNVSGAEI